MLDPPDIQDPPFIKEVIDEDVSGVAGAIFLFSTCGVRGFFDTDNCHRCTIDFLQCHQEIIIVGHLLQACHGSLCEQGSMVGWGLPGEEG